MAKENKIQAKKVKTKKRNPGVHSKNAPKSKPYKGQGR